MHVPLGYPKLAFTAGPSWPSLFGVHAPQGVHVPQGVRVPQGVHSNILRMYDQFLQKIFAADYQAMSTHSL